MCRAPARPSASSLALREQTLGPDHVWIADTLLSIGASHEIRGQLEQAERAYQRALTIHEQSSGPDAWAVAAIHNNLGVLLVARGQLDDAEQHYLRATDIWQRTLGSNASVLAHTAWGLSGIAYQRGDAAAAIEHAQRCVELRRANKAAPGELAEAELALARALWLQGERREQAVELAASVRAVYVGEGERRRKDLECLDAWLAEIGAAIE